MDSGRLNLCGKLVPYYAVSWKFQGHFAFHCHLLAQIRMRVSDVDVPAGGLARWTKVHVNLPIVRHTGLLAYLDGDRYGVLELKM